MKHKSEMIKNLIIISTLLFSTTGYAALPIGSPVIGQISVQSDFNNKIVPLPAGNWRVAYTGDSRIAGPGSGIGNISYSSYNNIETISLAQTAGTLLKALVTITLNTTTNTQKYNTPACITDKPNTIFYQNKYQSGVWDQRCLEVSHAVDFLNEESIQQAAIRSYLNRAGLSFPSTVIRMQYTEYNQRGQYLRVEMQINPMAYGFSDPAANYTQSPWHTDFLLRDQTRLSLMNDWSGYSQMYAEALHGAFENNAFGAVGGFQPRPQSMGSAKSNLSLVPAADYARTCMGIGFKSNTKALDDCVTELKSRTKK